MAVTEPMSAGHSSTVAAAERLETPTFEDAYDAYFDYVWRVMRRLGVRNAEDAVHDAFLVVHRRLPDFEGRSALKTWLYGIAVNVARDHRRLERRKGGLATLPDDLESDARTPEQLSADQEAVRLLDRVLSELDDDKREAYVLADVEGMNVPEIAQALGTNLNTLYSRLRAARAHVETRLQTLLEERT